MMSKTPPARAASSNSKDTPTDTAIAVACYEQVANAVTKGNPDIRELIIVDKRTFDLMKHEVAEKRREMDKYRQEYDRIFKKLYDFDSQIARSHAAREGLGGLLYRTKMLYPNEDEDVFQMTATLDEKIKQYEAAHLRAVAATEYYEKQDDDYKFMCENMPLLKKAMEEYDNMKAELIAIGKNLAFVETQDLIHKVTAIDIKRREKLAAVQDRLEACGALSGKHVEEMSKIREEADAEVDAILDSVKVTKTFKKKKEKMHITVAWHFFLPIVGLTLVALSLFLLGLYGGSICFIMAYVNYVVFSAYKASLKKE
ncbi:hypothetical protein CkaCkLH20_05237 [Colletotrichum karsti]|uniref:Uncharacterized protein n=1 Tax=Colletotrichum karsti TaxID=1095194 RepID=A0A9P6I889_9PEZI|nr:uncharacterized protein CkaCkLH20_05237 [Colletotrichum karsti]KAF9877537.1 hypothetical protein CkaCkLH20_05237 [Colletotrichum karsti]